MIVALIGSATRVRASADALEAEPCATTGPFAAAWYVGAGAAGGWAGSLGAAALDGAGASIAVARDALWTVGVPAGAGGGPDTDGAGVAEKTGLVGGKTGAGDGGEINGAGTGGGLAIVISKRAGGSAPLLHLPPRTGKHRCRLMCRYADT
jgi:hypothetical protein